MFEEEYIEEAATSYHSKLDYLIEAKLKLEHGRWVDVTEMFTTPKQLREMKIGRHSRRIIAKNIVGFNQLRDLGFKEDEIIKKYEKNTNKNE